MKLTRPMPPAEVLDRFGKSFTPAPELEEWARAALIDEDGELHNEDHAHLQHARLGFVWATVPNGRNGIRIVGQCEIMPPMGMGRWQKERAAQQVEEWFGFLPDFLITLDAHYAAQVDNLEFCSTVDHELYHAGQERDAFGAPKFTKAGRPKFAIRGHDVEEFVGIVRRYGAGAGAGATAQLVEAARHKPLIGSAQVSSACGTCKLLRAA